MATTDPKPKGLSAYQGRDLRKLDREALAAFARQFRTLTGDEPEKKHFFGAFTPWRVAPVKSDHAAWVCLEKYEGYPHPGMSAMRVHVFDVNWRRLRKQTVPTGYRVFLGEVTVEGNAALAQDLLVAKVAWSGPALAAMLGEKEGPSPEGSWDQKQYYGFTRDGLILIRLEDGKGQLLRKDYRWPPIGPAVPKRTTAQWVRSLESSSVVPRLAALVWLTGKHLPSQKERKDRDINIQESADASAVHESVRDDARTELVLWDLREHRNTWVKEYAELGVWWDVRQRPTRAFNGRGQSE